MTLLLGDADRFAARSGPRSLVAAVLAAMLTMGIAS